MGFQTTEDIVLVHVDSTSDLYAMIYYDVSLKALIDAKDLYAIYIYNVWQ